MSGPHHDAAPAGRDPEEGQDREDERRHRAEGRTSANAVSDDCTTPITNPAASVTQRDLSWPISAAASTGDHEERECGDVDADEVREKQSRDAAHDP